MRAGTLVAAAWLLTAAPSAGAAPLTAAGSPAAASAVRARLQAPVTAKFQEVEFASAVDFLAESAQINIILSQDARTTARPVTVHMVEMALQRALDYLVRGQGLVYRLDEDTIWIATRDEMEAEPLETRVYFPAQGPGVRAAFAPLSETRESVALQATGLQSVHTFRDLLIEVIPQVQDSSVVLDERTGALIITHVPYYLEQVERLLEQVDVAPPQVLIEARFLEVTLADTREWNFETALTGNAALTKKTAGDGTSGSGFQFSQLGSLSKGTETDFVAFTQQASGNGLNLTLQGVLSGTQYAAVLHALASTTRSKTLSAPRVTTLNNQTATIKIVTEFAYPTRYEASVKREDLNSDGDFEDVSSAGVRETRFVNVPQDFVTKDLGIVLNVTPSVGHDLRTITLALKPEVSEKKTDDSFGGSVTLPRFTTRNLETTVAVENGETVVLGGLMKDTTSIIKTKVPVLGSLPLVGLLFRKDSESVERSNLLIFVTAQLVAPSGVQLAAEPAL